jgi:hypothetical protein
VARRECLVASPESRVASQLRGGVRRDSRAAGETGIPHFVRFDKIQETTYKIQSKDPRERDWLTCRRCVL